MSLVLFMVALWGGFALMEIGFCYPELFIGGVRSLVNLAVKGKMAFSRFTVVNEKRLARMLQSQEKLLFGKTVHPKKV